MRRIVFTALMSAALIAVSGCSTDIDDAVITETLPETSETENGAVPVFLENTEKPDRMSERAVCLPRSLAEITDELGFADKVIARGTYCTSPESIASLPDAGRPTQPDIDMISLLAADAVLTSTELSGIDKTAIENIGAKVVYIPSSRSFYDLEQSYITVAQLFAGEEKGKNIGKEAFKALEKTFEENDTDLGGFVYITEGLSAAGGDTFESSVLSFFGENLAYEQSGYVSDMSFLEGKRLDTIILNDEYDKSDVINMFGEEYDDTKIIYVDSSYFESPSGRLKELVYRLSDELTGG